MLADFPAEIIRLIAKEIHRTSDLNQLCLTSRRLYKIATPFLYESVSVAANPVEFDWQWSWADFTQKLCKSPHLKLIRDITIEAPLYTRNEVCCLPDRLPYGARPGSEHPRFPQLKETLMRVFGALEEGKLRSFSWDLGTCIPPAIFSKTGYIQLKQSQLESISLIIDGRCISDDDGIQDWRDSAFSEFKSLKRLALRGFRSTREPDFLWQLLKQNSQHLMELELEPKEAWHGRDEGSWTPKWDLWPLDFDRDEVHAPRQRLLALKRLSLSKTQLSEWEGSGNGVANNLLSKSLDYGHLRSLRLWDCPHTGVFLNAFINANTARPTRLTTLEIFRRSEEGLQDTLGRFLRSFSGLRRLYLTLPGPIDSQDLVGAVTYHKASLARFLLFQSCSSQNITEMTVAGTGVDSSSINGLMIPCQNPEGESKVFETLDLQYLGLRCHPNRLISLLKPFQRKGCLRALHLRFAEDDLYEPAYYEVSDQALNSTAIYRYEPWRTGSRPRAPFRQDSIMFFSWNSKYGKLGNELRHFMRWAFGPTGIPSLELIALGDLYQGQEYQGLYAVRTPREALFELSPNTNEDKTMRRLRNPARVYSAADECFETIEFVRMEQHTLLTEFADALQACPDKSLIEEDPWRFGGWENQHMAPYGDREEEEQIHTLYYTSRH